MTHVLFCERIWSRPQLTTTTSVVPARESRILRGSHQLLDSSDDVRLQYEKFLSRRYDLDVTERSTTSSRSMKQSVL